MSKFIDWLEEWESVELSSVADVIDPHPSHRAPEEYQLGIPFAGIGDLDENGNLKNNGVRKVKACIFEEHIKRYKLTSNTIGFGRVASIGKIIDFKGFSNKVTISPTIAVVEPKNIEKKFLVNTLKSNTTKQQIDLLLTGSTRSSLGIALLRELVLPLPPLPEQQKIAKILTSVDEVIEKTQAQIDKLKDLKTGMMQELLTNGIGHTEFKDSPVGRIPAEWEVKSLVEVVQKIIDCEHKTAPYVDKSEYLVVRTSNVRNGELIHQDMKYTTEDGFKEWTKRSIPSVGDVLFTREAPAGESCLVPNNFKLCMGQRMVLLKPNLETVNSDYFSMYLSSEIASKEIYQLSIGTTVTRINIDDIKKIKCVVPALEEQTKIAASIGSIQSSILNKQSKLNSLVKVKKALMQDLLTGKVRVKVDI